MWLYQMQDEVYLVVLIKLLEVPPTKYVTMARKTISRSRACKSKFDWPKLLFEGRTLEQEIQFRRANCIDITDTETLDIKIAIAKHLLQTEDEGTLIPPLVEPLDAIIYNEPAL